MERKLKRRVPAEATLFARRLRSGATSAEILLWQRLRKSQMGNHKFTRQLPVGLYVVDFCCRAKMLIVEVDGGQHDINWAHDTARTAFLNALGYRVLRFWNNEVRNNPDGVLDVIEAALRAETQPTP
jgi:very-short-patch-repair endonuclease